MPLKKFKMFFNRLVSKVGSRQFVKNQHTRIAAATCKLPIVWYVLDKVNEVSRLFIKVSKKIILLEVMQQNVNYSRQQKVVFKVCIIR